jgi:leucine-rich PPR motif-containing protein, mitochondrial
LPKKCQFAEVLKMLSTIRFIQLTAGSLHRLTQFHRFHIIHQLSAKPTAAATNFDKFRLDVTTHKRVNSSLFEKIIQEETLHNQDANLLVAALSYMPDQSSDIKRQLLTNLFKRCTTDKILDPMLLCRLLQTIADQKLQVDLTALLKKANFPETSELLGAQLKYHCSFGDRDGIAQVLGKLKAQQVKLTEQMYSYLILGCSRQQDMEGVKNIVDTMAAANIELGSDSYTELIKAHLENGQHAKAGDLLSRIEGLPESNVVDIIRSIVQNATHFPSTDDLKTTLSMAIRHLPESSVRDPEMTPAIRNICTELALAKQLDTVAVLIECLPVPDVLPFSANADQYMARLIRDMAKEETINSAEILQVCQFLMDSKRNERAIHVAIEAALKCGRDKLAVDLLKQLSMLEPLRPHYFWPLFLSAQRKNRETGILQVLKVMRSLNVDVDEETVSNYLLPKLSITLKDTKRAIKVLEDNGLKLASFITALVSSLMYQRRVADVLEMLKAYPTRVAGESLVRPLVMLCTLKAVTPIDMAKLVRLLNERNSVGSFDIGGNVLVELVSSPKMNKQLELMVEEMLGEFQLVGVQVCVLWFQLISLHKYYILSSIVSQF